MSADSLVPVDRGVFNSSPPPGLGGGGTPGVVPTYPERCKSLDYHYDLITAVICAMYLVFGIVYSLFGYRCFKAVMFLTGFIFGSVIIYLICIQDKLLPPYVNAGMALSAGLLLGLITMLVQYVGLFMTGFHTGLFIGIVSLGVAEQVTHPPPSLLTAAGTLLGSGLLFAILNLQWPKGLTIFGTSVYGGAIMAGALDYFIEKLLMVHWVWDRVALRKGIQPCWFSWIILSVWPAMVMFGLVTQVAITGRGIHHQQLIPVKQRHANVARVRTREQRAEMRQKKYRYLYQVRTAHGDVISQNYVQALQRKVVGGVGPGESSTLQSDATHLTILPGDATAAQMAMTDDDEIQLDRRMRHMHDDSMNSSHYR